MVTRIIDKENLPEFDSALFEYLLDDYLVEVFFAAKYGQVEVKTSDFHVYADEEHIPEVRDLIELFRAYIEKATKDKDAEIAHLQRALKMAAEDYEALTVNLTNYLTEHNKKSCECQVLNIDSCDFCELYKSKECGCYSCKSTLTYHWMGKTEVRNEED